MQDAGGFHAVGGEAGEEESCLAVAEDHAALPGEGAPAAQLPLQSGKSVDMRLFTGFVTIDEVALYKLRVES